MYNIGLVSDLVLSTLSKCKVQNVKCCLNYSVIMLSLSLSLSLLHAYAVADKEVGYCQGLSFVAGLIILHVSYMYCIND